MATEVVTLLFGADTRPLKAANDELAKTERAGIRAQDAAKNMGVELKKAANDSIGPMQKASSGIGALSSAIIALGGALVARQFILYTNQWTDLNSRLINATGSAEAANFALAEISKTAERTYSSLQQTAQGFLQNNLVLSELGYTTSEQLDLMSALNNSLVISGAKGEQAAMIMGAFGRAMAEGKMKGQEFNLMMTYSARTVQALADGLGKTTIELREMVSAGELDAATMFAAMTSEMVKLNAEAEAMPATIGDSFVQMGNLALEFIGRVDQAMGASEGVGGWIVKSVSNWRQTMNAAFDDINEANLGPLQQELFTLQRALDNPFYSANAKAEKEERINEIREQIDMISIVNDARHSNAILEEAEGLKLRAQREEESKAEILRIKAESTAKIEADKKQKELESKEREQARVNTSAQGIAESLMAQEEQIKLSYNKQRDIILQSTAFTEDQKRIITLQSHAKEIEDLDALNDKKLESDRTFQENQLIQFLESKRSQVAAQNKVDEQRIEAQAQQTAQLLAFEDVLLQGKNSAVQEAYRIGVNYADKDKRATAAKIIMKSYEAAMNAYASLSVIPIIGPALGAAAAGTIIAAGVSFSAKSLAGRALGGQVRGGESYVVGERGPEILTMGGNGRITPNSSISNISQAKTVNNTANVTFSITANDTRGFDELLLKRRGMIASLVQSSLNNVGRSI
tara:strand:+ start:8432 stop:10504 length:2073 start_codon:yes stop_codon:yes gene_type:complete